MFRLNRCCPNPGFETARHTSRRHTHVMQAVVHGHSCFTGDKMAVRFVKSIQCSVWKRCVTEASRQRRRTQKKTWGRLVRSCCTVACNQKFTHASSHIGCGHVDPRSAENAGQAKSPRLQALSGGRTACTVRLCNIAATFAGMRESQSQIHRLIRIELNCS